MRAIIFVLIMTLSTAVSAAEATCPPKVAWDYCFNGCPELGAWVVTSVANPETARAGLAPVQYETALIVHATGMRPGWLMIHRELLAAPVPLPSWGWRWEVYESPTASIEAAADSHASGGSLFTTLTGEVVRIYWVDCDQDPTRLRSARR